MIDEDILKAQNNKILKVGLLVPLSGVYSELGSSILYSLQLALEEIDDKNISIVPRDSGFNDKEKPRDRTIIILGIRYLIIHDWFKSNC